MENIQPFIDKILLLITKDEMKEALKEAESLLKGSPLFFELVQQKSRYSSLMRAIQRGTVAYEKANVEANKIRYGLMDLLIQLGEGTDENAQLKEDVETVLRQSITNNTSTISGNDNINIQGVSGSDFNIQIGKK